MKLSLSGSLFLAFGLRHRAAEFVFPRFSRGHLMGQAKESHSLLNNSTKSGQNLHVVWLAPLNLWDGNVFFLSATLMQNKISQELRIGLTHPTHSCDFDTDFHCSKRWDLMSVVIFNISNNTWFLNPNNVTCGFSVSSHFYTVHVQLFQVLFIATIDKYFCVTPAKPVTFQTDGPLCSMLTANRFATPHTRLFNKTKKGTCLPSACYHLNDKVKIPSGGLVLSLCFSPNKVTSDVLLFGLCEAGSPCSRWCPLEEFTACFFWFNANKPSFMAQILRGHGPHGLMLLWKGNTT